MLLALPSWAATDRINWIVEQLVLPPLPPVAEKAGFQTGLHGVNYSDAFSFLGHLLYDSRVLDVGVKYSERVFPGWTQTSETLSRESLGLKKSLSFEVGRGYLTNENHFGRFSLEWIQLDPSVFRLLRIGVNTALLETLDLAWIFRFNFNVLIPIQQPTHNPDSSLNPSIKEMALYHSSFEIGQIWDLNSHINFKLGGLFSWTYRQRKLSDALEYVGIYEHMLFSLGPWAEFGNKTSRLRLSIPWRIWVDKEIFPRPQSIVAPEPALTRYPSSIGFPDLSLTWSLSL